MIGVVELMEENVRPSFDVRYRRMNERPLLRLVYPQGRWAGQGPRKGKARADTPR
jgi:hypothetical protein